ncbi:MAG: ribosomal protein small subunit ribosomal protein [Candidatus Parcubacteria bacterium]|jgi:small subunit ribosomal protein S4
MIIGPRYKIARRLGVPVFEKTQTQKFAMRSAARDGGKGAGKGRPKAKSDFGLGLLEKQKARYSYGVTSKQFGNYIAKAVEKKGNSAELLVRLLESRLDNVALRAGFATTRAAARQMVSHGHITVNGKRVTIPSYSVSVGDIISIREGSKKKALYNTLDERLKAVKIPAWLKLDFDKKVVTVDGLPFAPTTELLFNPGAVLEFYSR